MVSEIKKIWMLISIGTGQSSQQVWKWPMQVSKNDLRVLKKLSISEYALFLVSLEIIYCCFSWLCIFDAWLVGF